jgi:hypothetical protein
LRSPTCSLSLGLCAAISSTWSVLSVPPSASCHRPDLRRAPESAAPALSLAGLSHRFSLTKLSMHMVRCAIIAKICTNLIRMRHNKHVLYRGQYRPRSLQPSIRWLIHLALLSSLRQSDISNQLELVECTNWKVFVGRFAGDLAASNLFMED